MRDIRICSMKIEWCSCNSIMALIKNEQYNSLMALNKNEQYLESKFKLKRTIIFFYLKSCRIIFIYIEKV